MVKDLNDPTNRDSVPAMLTPGEFVLNKEASTMFGPLIEKMNNAGLQQRKAENQMVKANTGMMIPPGHHKMPDGTMMADAAHKGYNVGGLVTFLKEKEGYEDNAYQDDAGVWTIGYGRTTNPDGSPVQPGQTTQREKEDSWLQTRAASELEAVKGYATKYGYDLNDGQLNALASFRYNGGQGMLDMLTDNGQRDLATIQQKFGQYNKVTDPETGEKVFVQGLQNRRDAELELWAGTTPTETQPAPQPLASNETTQAIVAPPPEELPPPPAQAINAALVEANQPAVPQQEVAAPQAAENFLPTIADGLKLGAGAPEMLQPVPQLQQVNPEFIPSVTAQTPVQGSNPMLRNFNEGGLAAWWNQPEFKEWHKPSGGFKSGQHKRNWQRQENAARRQWEKAQGQNNQSFLGALARSVGKGVGNLNDAVQDANEAKRKRKAKEKASESNLSHLAKRQAEYERNLAAAKVANEKKAAEAVEAYHRNKTVQEPKYEHVPGRGVPVVQSEPPKPAGLPQKTVDAKNNQLSNLLSARSNFEEGSDVYKNYTKTINKIQEELQGYNGGGQVQYLRNGGRADITDQERERRRLARLHGANNTSGGRNEARQSPFISAITPQQPQRPFANTVLPLPMMRDPNINRFGQQAGVLQGQINAAGSQQPMTVPYADNTPPVPGSDEAILQGSSQQVEQQEEQRAVVPGDPRIETNEVLGTHGQLPAAPPPLDQVPPQQGRRRTERGGPATAEQLGEDYSTAYVPGQQRAKSRVAGRPDTPVGDLSQNPITQVDPYTGEVTFADGQVAVDPTQEQVARIEGRPEVPVGSLPTSGGRNEVRGEAEPAAEDAREKAIANREPAEKAAIAQTKVDEIIQKDPAAATPPTKEKLAEAKAAAQKAPADGVNRAKGVLQSTFGDLFDQKELGRMAILFAGAMVTGMSPGQALAFAGTNYIQRLDAQASNKAATHKALVTGGKFSPASIKAYMDSGDPSALVPVGVAPEATGNFKTLYGAGGKKVVVQEMKVGKNTILVDQNGKQVSGYDLQEDPSNARGSKEWRARIDKSTGHIKDQLTEMRKEFDVFQTDKGEGSKTNILPTTSATKIAEWAADNGVEPDQLGGLVESAYHDALNDRRQDGAKARDLVPYLRQLVIRNQVKGSADLFKTKKQSEEGPPTYVSPKKLAVLNGAASDYLRSAGHKGGVQDLSNMFYNAALEDWNELTPGVKAEWERAALGDENGFYKYIQKWLLSKRGG